MPQGNGSPPVWRGRPLFRCGEKVNYMPQAVGPGGREGGVQPAEGALQVGAGYRQARGNRS